MAIPRVAPSVESLTRVSCRVPARTARPWDSSCADPRPARVLRRRPGRPHGRGRTVPRTRDPVTGRLVDSTSPGQNAGAPT
jgi:hypothetical protein